MKRKLEEESINLIGRTAAERSLDRIYNRQKAELKKLKSKEDDTKTYIAFNKQLPFPEVSNKDNTLKSDPKPTLKSEPTKRTLNEVLDDLRKKHIPNRNKFAKGVALLSKLSNSYFKESYKTETDVTHMDFFSVFNTVNDVFVREFSGIVPKYCLDEKAALSSLTEVIDYLLSLSNKPDSAVVKVQTKDEVKTEQNDRKISTEDKKLNQSLNRYSHKFTFEEVLFLKLLKVSFCYASSLWYENDPFVFHTIVNNLKSFFEDFLSETTNGFVVTDLSRPVGVGFELPTRDELMTLQLKSFVRTLSVVFTFFDMPWSKSSLVPLFSLVYLKRDVFDEADKTRITNWQSHINSNRAKGYKCKSTIYTIYIQIYTYYNNQWNININIRLIKLFNV
uniref:Uncharacterized protein n=1 Tax=Theileria annulata TaxID=5874 RepID=A0A3B0MY71_THEAN